MSMTNSIVLLAVLVIPKHNILKLTSIYLYLVSGSGSPRNFVPVHAPHSAPPCPS
jgi:hypothetical protein